MICRIHLIVHTTPQLCRGRGSSAEHGKQRGASDLCVAYGRDLHVVGLVTPLSDQSGTEKDTAENEHITTQVQGRGDESMGCVRTTWLTAGFRNAHTPSRKRPRGRAAG
eukprot:4906427-Prymnesium_polylepis.1